MQSHDHVTNRLAHVNLKLHFLGHTWWACRLPPLTHPCRACLLKLFFFLPIQGMVFENFPLSPAWHAGLSYFSFPAYIGSSSWNHLLSCPHEARLLKLSPFYHPYMACLEKFCLAPPIRGVASETPPFPAQIWQYAEWPYLRTHHRIRIHIRNAIAFNIHWNLPEPGQLTPTFSSRQ